MLQYYFCFMFWFVDYEACGVLAPRPGIESSPPALEDHVLTTGLLGKFIFSLSAVCLQLWVLTGRTLQLPWEDVLSSHP